ncbi:hypothetical protein VPH35_134692 [Triticum aestivum]|uniref:uncharacterized protein n=1 Tax=Triticum aestivum TaxID=4565 RepID=UPI001D0255C7|nr:uncharacterized protein LOC123173013 [Triticum aestivum]
MAELASGAVSSLLGVIRNEALLLGRVRHDVQFIQEEMESMQSFLTHLSKKAPTGGEHDEQIRTWMNQVRLLAQDSNNCIDLYLYRGNPEIHLARGGLRRYIAWLPWFVHKMVAQHRAAIQLRALRERARDIGERRLRYGVEVPAKGAGVGQSPAGAGPTLAAIGSPVVHVASTSNASGGEEDDSDDQDVMALVVTNRSHPRGACFEPRTPEENVRVKLAEWIQNVAQCNTVKGGSVPSVAIVAPDKHETLAIAKEASAMWKKCSVLVDIPAVHFYSRALRTEDILYYILRELQLAKSQPQQQEVQGGGDEDINKTKREILSQKGEVVREITKIIQGMKVNKKISEIKSTLQNMKDNQLQLNLTEMSKDELGLLESAKDEPLGIFLRALWLLKLKPAKGAPAHKQVQERKGETRSRDDVIKETAKMLKKHMEIHAEDEKEEPHTKQILLKEAQYEDLLREVFPPVTIRKDPQNQEEDSKQATAINTTAGTTIILVEDQFKDMIRKILQELQEDKSMKNKKLDTTELREDISLKDKKIDTTELQEDKSEKKLDTTELQEVKSMKKPSQDFILDALIEETMERFWEIEWEMNQQLVIKGIMDKIRDCFDRKGDEIILVILKLDYDWVSGWEETKKAFSIFGCIAGALMLTFEENRTRAKGYCCPSREPIDYSVLGLYHDITLELTNQQMNKESAQIFLGILENCHQHEFCMKIFVHALYANPKRSDEELSKLHRTLQKVIDKSLDKIAKKILKFSYSDMPKEYKSCLMYLAIFPRRQPIRRSTLIGRWVVEGLITKEDWASSVRHASRCFDALINRWLVYPADIGATGKIKSCVIGDLVHEFITKIARKRRIVETRLSHHLALRFSIFNDLRLRGSDKIDRFFEKLHEESSRVSLIKVLDLQDCQCFGRKNQIYLRDICSKMLLLKYLSLRGTDVTQLPTEINNLRELEVLDIRETYVPPSATVNVLLLKLKRLLAGRIVPSSGVSSTELFSVEIPDKVEKMVNMEVLSNVKARTRQDMKDIGKLWQLRKLGVVIQYKEPHLRNFLRAISDLHECLKSLSITLPNIEDNKEIRDWVLEHYKNSPKLLESLSITGTTQTVQLLRLLTRDIDQLQLRKVTLSGTRLYQPDLKVLGKLPKLICLRLRDNAYIDSNLTFNNDEFENLKCFLIEGSNITALSFGGGAHKLEKIVLCSTDGLSISGVEDLLELKDVELKNSNKLSLFDKAKNISKVTLWHTSLSQYEVEILAKIPNMRNLVLKDIFCVQSQLILYKDDFPKLNLLTVDFSVTPKTIITDGSAPKLEKIIWSFTKDTVGTLSISGTDILPNLKELEINGDFIPREVEEALKKHKNKPKFTYNKPENQYQEAGNIPEKKDPPRFSFLRKKED